MNEHKCSLSFERRWNGEYKCETDDCSLIYTGVELEDSLYPSKNTFMTCDEYRNRLFSTGMKNVNYVYFFNNGYYYKCIDVARRSINIIHVDDYHIKLKIKSIRCSVLFMLHRAQIRWRKRRFEARSLYLQHRFNLSSHLAAYLTAFIAPSNHFSKIQHADNRT